MSTPTPTRFERAVTLPATAAEVFAWHEREGAFERLCPPWDPVEVLHKDPHIRDGARVALRVRALGASLRLEVTHRGYVAGERFIDEQVRGPFRAWAHTHAVAPDPSNPARATLTDSIDYALPLPPFGPLFGGGLARRRLEQLFHYRHTLMTHDLTLHALARAHGAEGLRVGVSGATGLIGEALCALLTTGGHAVVRFVRAAPRGPNERAWPTPDQVPDLSDLDAVVHLAGEGVAQRWTPAARQRIEESRTLRTAALAAALAAARASGGRPRALICASAVGYYGYDSVGEGAPLLDESAPRGEGFLARVCEGWEAACEPARAAGVRVVNARLGVALSPRGGALAKLLTPFSLGLGGPVGGGAQWMSWVSLHDAVGALYLCLTHPEARGPINICAPAPATSATFARALGAALSRPALLPAPPLALRLAFGEMAREALLGGQRAVPARLEALGYPFLLPTLAGALRFELGRVPLAPSGG